MLAWGEHSSRPVYIISVLGQSVSAGMPCQHDIFYAELLISRFSLEIYITFLQVWQTVLVWNLYPIFMLLNQLAVKITPAESFLWMHLHQFQYLFIHHFSQHTRWLNMSDQIKTTSDGSWCMGIKGEMSGTVCVTFTWYMYIYELFIAFVCFVVCSLLWRHSLWHYINLVNLNLNFGK